MFGSINEDDEKNSQKFLVCSLNPTRKSCVGDPQTPTDKIPYVIALHNNYSPILYRFRDIKRRKWRAIHIRVRGRSRSLQMAPVDRSCMTSYWSVIVNIALFCTTFEILDGEEEYSDLEI